ncbi:MAG: hypothetical protein CV090_06925 [Nitrospira sp. WS238]|nr:hypothetical protein [Nitrospira sp. WS238]
MSNPEPTIRINVDVTNPGQFFACCGLLELADRLWPGAEGWFDNTIFNLCADGSIREMLTRITLNTPNEKLLVCGNVPVKPIIAPLELMLGSEATQLLVIDFWMCVAVVKGKVQAISNPPWNCWSGQQTPLRIWMSLRDALRETLDKKSDDELHNLFMITSPLTGRFGFDSVAAWSALDIGFSPNDQGMAVRSSPASELLAAVGIQRFRPLVSDDRQTISYATWSIPVGPTVAATMASLAVSGGGISYELSVISRGQYAALGHAKLKQGVSNHVYV